MERKVRTINGWSSPTIGEELVSRIPYQCNNRSTGLYIKPIQTGPLQWSCLHSSPYTISHWRNALRCCLTRFWMSELVSESGGRGRLRTPRLSGSKKFYKNFRRGSTCPSPESLHPNLPYILDYNPRLLYLNSHLLCRRFLWYTHLQPFYSIFQCS